MSETNLRYTAQGLARILDLPVPTPEQQAIIEAPLAPTLVVAGAGSGKTETMSARVVYLVANNLAAPESILGLTFTRKAAGELADRIRGRMAALRRRGVLHHAALGDLGRPMVATYNSYCASLVRDHGIRVGVDPQAEVLSATTRWQLMYRIVAGWSGDLDATYSLSSLVDYALRLSDELAEHEVTPADASRWYTETSQAIAQLQPAGRRTSPGDVLRRFVEKVPDRRALCELVQAYRDAKAQAGVIDFADQVAWAARVAESDPSVGQTERQRYTCVLLDEYQDTSAGQLRVLRRIFGGGHAVMAVGDPNQSIYGWRGASAGGLAGFPQDFPDLSGAPAPVLPLSVAWRNDQAILNAANEIAAPLRTSLAIDLPQLAQREGAGAGEVALGYYDTYVTEADAVAQYIAELWRPGRSAAVLCRNRAWFTPFADALRRAGLPVHVVGLGGLVDIPEVAEILSALRVVHDPGRGDALMRLVAGAHCALGAADLAVLGSWAASLSRASGGGGIDIALAETLDELPPAHYVDEHGHRLSNEARTRLSALARTLERLRTMTYLAVPELVVATEQALGIDIDVLARSGPSGRVHVEALVDTARSFARSGDLRTAPTLGAFLDWVDAAARHDNGLEPGHVDVETDAVQVLTVHASKGLEWDVVAVPRLSDGTLPKVERDKEAAPRSNAWLSDAGALPYPLRRDCAFLPQLDLEAAGDVVGAQELVAQFAHDAGAYEELEERRVAYVALTRARSHLLVTGSFWSTATRPAYPSPFLVDIADLDGVRTLSWADEPTDGAQNPVLAEQIVGLWPTDPLGARRPVIQLAAEWIARARPADLEAQPDMLRQARVLLQERDRPRGAVAVPLPDHLSASALITLARDPQQYAEQLRRPMPTQPHVTTRQGTAFHSWVESYLGVSTLFDPEDEDLSSNDLDTSAHHDLAPLREAFLASRWAAGEGLEKLAVEEQLEIPLGPATLRCRVDAVFRDTATGRIQIVDWKTGAVPHVAAERELRDIQLSAYRVGYAARHGVDENQIDTFYHYVASQQTVAPRRMYSREELADLLSARPAAVNRRSL